MKKIIATIAMVVVLFMFSGCGNKDLFDTNYTFNYAIVEFPGEEVRKIEISKWTDYENGEQIQIIAKDGNTYLIHAANCVLVREK